MMLMGAALLTTMTGCYCWGPGFGFGGGYPGCAGGACGYAPYAPQPGVIAPGTVAPGAVTPGVYPSTGAYYSPYNTMQTATPLGAPVSLGQPVAYPTTALAPLESLPTY